MVPLEEIDLADHLAPSHSGFEIDHVGSQVGVGNRRAVDVAVVAPWSPSCVHLVDHLHGDAQGPAGDAGSFQGGGLRLCFPSFLVSRWWKGDVMAGPDVYIIHCVRSVAVRQWGSRCPETHPLSPEGIPFPRPWGLGSDGAMYV